MKNIVQSVKPSEPLKAVETANKSVEGVSRQQSENPEQNKQFQSMLEKQVEDRKLQEKQLQSNKANSNKPQATKAGEAKANVADAKNTVIQGDGNSHLTEPTEQDPSQQTAATKKGAPTDTLAKHMPSEPKSPITDHQIKASNLDQTKVANTSELQADQVATAAKDGVAQPKAVINDDGLAKGELKTAINQAVDLVKAPKQVADDPANKVVDAKPNAAPIQAEKLPHADKHQKVSSEVLDKKTTLAEPVDLKPANKRHGSEAKLPNAVSEKHAPVDQVLSDEFAADIEGVDDLFVSNRKVLAHTDKDAVADVSVETDQQKMPLIRSDFVDAKVPLQVQAKTVETTAPTTAIQQPMTDKTEVDLAADQILPSAVNEMAKQKMQSDLREQMIGKSQALKEQQLTGDKDNLSLNDKAFYASLNESAKDNMLGKARLTDLNQTLNLNNFQNTVKLGTEQANMPKPVNANPLQTVTDFSSSAQAVVGSQSMPTQNMLQTNTGLLAAQQTAGSSQIYQQFGKPGWNQAVNQKVLYMVGNGDQSAKLTLNPPDLGPLQVVVNVNNDKADTTFISNNADVRQALEDGMENLRAQLDDAGISLGQANVNAGAQFEQQTGEQGESATQTSHVATDSEPLLESQTVVRESNGLVDIFA